MKMLGRLRWIALAWCACSAALGVYVAAGGLGWLTGLAQAFGLAIGFVLWLAAMLTSRLAGRGKRLGQAAMGLWLAGLGLTLYAVLSALSAVGAIILFLLILYVLGGGRR
jgi:hypothetical protein